MTSTMISGKDQLKALGERLRKRLEPGRGERPGRPSDPTWTIQRKLSMNADTLSTLEIIAKDISSEERQVSPMQITALLIEDATHGLVEQLKQN